VAKGESYKANHGNGGSVVNYRRHSFFLVFMLIGKKTLFTLISRLKTDFFAFLYNFCFLEFFIFLFHRKKNAKKETFKMENDPQENEMCKSIDDVPEEIIAQITKRMEEKMILKMQPLLQQLLELQLLLLGKGKQE